MNWGPPAACLLAAAMASAQPDPSSVRGESTDPAVLTLREKIAQDPAVADAVARRVARSRLKDLLTPASENDTALAAAKRWTADDPDSAARIMIGLMQDDATGTTTYESSLLRQVRTGYEKNPGAEKNLFNRLRRTARDSKLLKKQSEEISEDEKREILRAIFEGKSGHAGQALRDKPEDNPAAGKTSASATSFSGIYDRLSAANLRGYSPQLLALQSALNQRRPPGAPALVETGKLDYPTLAYPAYAMDFDIRNLGERLRRDLLASLAKMAGLTPRSEDWNDPGFEDRLRHAAPNQTLSPRLKSRMDAIVKAREAKQAFLTKAENAKQPEKLTRTLLVELGDLQRDAARWIAVAALEEELGRFEELETFLTPELEAAIRDVPAPADVHSAYLAHGRDLQKRVSVLKSNARKAQDLLRSSEWRTRLAAVDELSNENRRLKKNVGPEIEDFVRTPFEIREANVVRPRWRQILDDFAVRWAPTLAYSRAITARRRALARLLGVFSMIASADTAMPQTNRIVP